MKTLRVHLLLVWTAGCLLVGESARAANTTPPTITANNQIAECRQPTVSVWINPKLTSNWDPLPYATFTNRLAGDPATFPTNSDPDLYPYGTRNVTIRGCDHNTPTANCNNKIVSVTVRDTLAPSVYGGANKIVQCASYQGTPAYVSTTGTPYCTDTCTAQCSACQNANTVNSTTCTNCFNPCMATCTSNPNVVALDKPQVSDICDPNARWVADLPPAFFPLGSTALHVTGYDFTGNTTVKNVLVQVQDVKSPFFVSSPPSLNVQSHANTGDALSCVYCSAPGPGGSCTSSQPGTYVVLPTLNANDNCTSLYNMAYSWLLQGMVNQTPQNPRVCIPDTGSTPVTVQFVVTDASGNTDTSRGAAATTSKIAVKAVFPVAITMLAQSAGYVKQGVIQAQATSGTGPFTWGIVGATQPDSPVGNGATINATFSTEGNYCPLYVSVTDAASNGGATPYNCFGVDRTAPAHVFNNIPTTGQWPGNNTPLFSQGAAMPLQILANDSNGRVPSGVQRVTATLQTPANGNIVVYDNDYTQQCSTNPNGLKVCLPVQSVAGCNKGLGQGGSAVCMCTGVDALGECTSDGRLDLGQVPKGAYTMQITATDFAGNAETQTYPFMVTALGDGFANNANNNLVAMLQALIANPTTPVAALSSLTAATGYATSAATVFSESPGQSFLLAQQVWAQLDQAQNNGANASFYKNFVANMVEGEVRKIYEATAQNGNLTPWPILVDPNHVLPSFYQVRNFLVKQGGTLRDYQVQPAVTLSLASKLVAIADHDLQGGQTSQAISDAVSAFDSMAILFMDSTFAQLYGRGVNTAYVGTAATPVSEAYYRASPASHFGAESAATVAAELTRFNTLAQGGALYGVPPTVLTTLANVTSRLASFSTAVSIVQNSNWSVAGNSNFTNYRLVNDVYLNAIGALQGLATVQGSSIYTRYWQTGLAYTLGATLNFSIYAGPSAMDCVLWGQDSDGFSGCSGVKNPNAPLILDQQGSTEGHAIDWEAQVAECRYSRMMYALADGRMTGSAGAVSLFTNSTCQIVDIYNRYYGGTKQFFPGDAVIDPTAYGCPTTPAAFTASDGATACGGCNLGNGVVAGSDTTCDGIDDDCNGVADNSFVSASCGCSTTNPGANASVICPCAANSSCLAGQYVACVPGFAPALNDTQCNGKDNNCNGTIGEGYLPTSCGVGGCVSYSSCVSGSLHACVPKAASLEVCNGLDDDCNILVDEFLDNDNDGYGCAPCTSYTTQAKCGASLACTWSAGACTGAVTCKQCDPTVSTCLAVGNPNSLLCSGDVKNGAWTGLWDCADNDPVVYPGGTEVCDGKDNNCNGQIDEGVKNACGNCDPSCTSTLLGTPGTPFTPTPNNSQNISQDPNTGNVGLTSQQVNTQFAWVANDTAGTVSKIDTVTGKEVGRYCQALKTGVTNFVGPGNKDPTGASYDTRAEPTVCAGCGGCNRGSRTAVDKSGNMYIANRAHSPTAYQGTITMIAGNTSGCVDVDGDGVIETSKDVNGDGAINPNIGLPPSTREYWGELDECIKWTHKPDTWFPASGVQPSCNNPNWPPNNNVTDPNNITYTDEQATCLSDPNSYVVSSATAYNVCQWTNYCQGNGDTSCSTRTTQATCDPNLKGYFPNSPNATNFCTWTSACTGPTGCSNNANAIACNAQAAAGCSWVGGCSATACSISNSNKPQCNGRSGCSWFQDCFNIGATPYSSSVGPILPRAVAIDAQGYVWLGLYNRNGLARLEPNTGLVTRWVYDGQPPYGAAIDKNGILWHTKGCCGQAGLMSINTNPNAVTYVNPDNGNVTWSWTALGVSGPTGYWHTHPNNPGTGSYGIAVDGLNRVYLGSYPSQVDAGYRYDSGRNTWVTFKSSLDPNGNRLKDAGIGRGLTVDAGGQVWIAQHGDGGGRLTQFDSNTLMPLVDVYLAPKGTIPIGVGIGYGGKIWTNNQGTSNVSVVDPQTSLVGFFPTGGPPYTYSDFTGSILRTFTAPQGTYSEIVNACYGFQVNSWVNLLWNGITPTGTANQGRTSSPTAIRFRIRAANTLVTKDTSGNPVDPAVASNWSLWFPDDISDPNKNASDPNRVYYYDLQPQSKWPVSGPCAGQQSVNGAYVAGCADLTTMPTTYTWQASAPNQPIAYIQVQAVLVSDSDNSVQPTLVNYQVSRTCPQL